MGVYRFLLSRQWVILTLLGLVMIPVMIRLGFWQLHRYESKVAHDQLITHSLAAPPVPVDRLTGVGREPHDDDQFRTVRATGTYDTRHEVVVRQRTGADDQSIGYFVLTPLVRSDGTAVLVNRGWIPASGDLTKFPDVPQAPKGKVTVTGRMMADETSEASGIKDKTGLPPRQVMLINSKKQAKSLDRPVLGGYLQLTATSPKPTGKQPELLPKPEMSNSALNMAYAVQWWVFAAGVPIAWVILVRRERRDRLAKASAGDEDTAGAAPDESGASGEAETRVEGVDAPSVAGTAGASRTDD